MFLDFAIYLHMSYVSLAFIARRYDVPLSQVKQLLHKAELAALNGTPTKSAIERKIAFPFKSSSREGKDRTSFRWCLNRTGFLFESSGRMRRDSVRSYLASEEGEANCLSLHQMSDVVEHLCALFREAGEILAVNAVVEHLYPSLVDGQIRRLEDISAPLLSLIVRHGLDFDAVRLLTDAFSGRIGRMDSSIIPDLPATTEEVAPFFCAVDEVATSILRALDAFDARVGTRLRARLSHLQAWTARHLAAQAQEA